MWFQCIFSIR